MLPIDFWPQRSMNLDKVVKGLLVAVATIVVVSIAGQWVMSYARGQAEVAKTLLELERKKRAKKKKPIAEDRAEFEKERDLWRQQEEEAKAAPTRARGAMLALSAFDVQGAQIDRFLLKWEGNLATLRSEGTALTRSSALAAGHALTVFGPVTSGGAIDIGWDGQAWSFMVKELPPLPPKPPEPVKTVPPAKPLSGTATSGLVPPSSPLHSSTNGSNTTSFERHHPWGEYT